MTFAILLVLLSSCAVRITPTKVNKGLGKPFYGKRVIPDTLVTTRGPGLAWELRFDQHRRIFVRNTETGIIDSTQFFFSRGIVVSGRTYIRTVTLNQIETDSIRHWTYIIVNNSRMKPEMLVLHHTFASAIDSAYRVEDLQLYKGKKIKNIETGDELTVLSTLLPTGSHGDSVRRRIRGEMLSFLNDTLNLQASFVSSLYRFERNDSIAWVTQDSGHKISIAMGQVERIHLHRSELKSALTSIGVTAFLVQPLILGAVFVFRNHPDATIPLALIGVAAGITWPSAIITGAIIGKQRFRLDEKAPPRRRWRVFRQVLYY